MKSLYSPYGGMNGSYSPYGGMNGYMKSLFLIYPTNSNLPFPSPWTKTFFIASLLSFLQPFEGKW